MFKCNYLLTNYTLKCITKSWKGGDNMKKQIKSPIKWEKLEAQKAQPAPEVLSRKLNFSK